jgi:hypothetical protein
MGGINGVLTTEVERVLAEAAATLRLATEIRDMLSGNPECLWRGSW